MGNVILTALLLFRISVFTISKNIHHSQYSYKLHLFFINPYHYFLLTYLKRQDEYKRRSFNDIK